MRSSEPPIGDNSTLSKDALLKPIPKAIVNGNLYLLHNQHHSRLIGKVIPKVAFAEEVVQVVVEAILLFVDDENLGGLLHDGLLEAVVNDLEVVFLDLDDLLLVVEVLEAVDEVEVVAEASLAGSDVPSVGCTVGDGLSGYKMSSVLALMCECKLKNIPAKPVARASVAQVLKNMTKY